MTENGHAGEQGALVNATNPEVMHNEDAAARFESAWTEAGPRIKSMLQRQGVAPDIADDVVQETGMKLFTTWDRVDPNRPLWPLARTIAMNSLRDRVRRDRLRLVEDVPDQPMGYDLEDHVLARARLRCVGTAISELGASDRIALLTEIAATKSDQSSRLKMARLRARRRLDRALEDMAGAFGAVQLAARRICALGVPKAVSDIQPMAPIAIGLVAILGVTAPTMPRGSVATPSHGVHRVDVRLAAQLQPKAAHANQPARRDRRSHAEHLVDRGSTAVGSAAAHPQPSPTPSSRRSTVASAGGARATTKEGQGYRSVGVCTDGDGSGDDHYASVTVDDGSQNPNEDEGACT